MIVVDANTLAYYHLDSEFSEIALDAFQRDPHWIAPLLWRSEFQNILAGYIRRNLISLSKAKRIVDEALRMMEESEFQAPAHKVLELITSSTCSPYDCEYVALAKQFNIPLLTKDKRVLSQFPDTAIKLEDFIAS